MLIIRKSCCNSNATQIPFFYRHGDTTNASHIGSLTRLAFASITPSFPDSCVRSKPELINELKSEQKSVANRCRSDTVDTLKGLFTNIASENLPRTASPIFQVIIIPFLTGNTTHQANRLHLLTFTNWSKKEKKKKGKCAQNGVQIINTSINIKSNKMKLPPTTRVNSVVMFYKPKIETS